MREKRKKSILRKILLTLLLVFFLALAGFVTWYLIDTRFTPPDVNEQIADQLKREKTGEDAYRIGSSWLRKNKYGLWEMYLEGEPFEMGVISGKLTRELIYEQESAFVNKIRELVPSESYLSFLKYFIRFFNRDIDEYILPEYKEEIYGISLSASEDFGFIGSNYERMLNYHGAHDIGHALQDLMLVGCTSFAANMGFADSSLIIGRNFDFFISEEFARNIIICFVKPAQGFKFTYVTWASFIGVVSGINEAGLTVTINAGKSDIPTSAATPISLLAREILQYAENMEEAITIAEKRQTFVSESLLIGSAGDNRAIIIEKSPTRIDIYESGNDWLVCANHFQSQAFSADETNIEHRSRSASGDRQERAVELLTRNDTVSYLQAAEILRDRQGGKGQSIGLGNEKAMAQMISHHSVIMQPLKHRLWVSTPPYQFGPFLCYSLDSLFSHPYMPQDHGRYDSSLTIPADHFIFSDQYNDFLQYKNMRHMIKEAIKHKTILNDTVIKSFLSLNPDYYEGYVLAGDYYAEQDESDKASAYYQQALQKEFEHEDQKREVEEKLKQLP
jgi:isopenicillin-N N-acyltransferase like protein